MRSPHVFFFTTVAFALGLLPAQAVECRILAWDQDVPDVIVRGAGGDKTLLVGANFIAGPWTAPAAAPLVLHRSVPVTPENRAGREILATGTLPPETPRVLLILSKNSAPSPGHPEPYRLMALPDIDRATAANHVRIYNFSTRPAAWSIGSQPARPVAPGAQDVLDYADGAKRGRLKVAMSMTASWELIVSRTITLPDANRVLLFVRDVQIGPDDASALPVQVRQIYEPVTPPEPLPAAPPAGG